MRNVTVGIFFFSFDFPLFLRIFLILFVFLEEEQRFIARKNDSKGMIQTITVPAPQIYN